MTEEKAQNPTGAFPERQGGEEPAMRDREVELISVTDDLDALDKAVQTTAKMVETYKAIRGICLRLTNEDDWTFQGDNLYLNATGADKLAIAWGVDVTPEKIEREDFDDASGRYYIYTVFGTAFSRRLGRMIREIGTCSSRDDFFGRVTEKQQDGSLVKVWKALDKVDATDIKKKAVTNFMGRSIKRLIGFGNITVEELGAARLDVNKIGKVDFKKDKRTAEANASPELKRLRGEIDSIAEYLSNGEAEAKAGCIRQSSYFKSGDKEMFVTAAVEMTSEKWAFTTLGRMKSLLHDQFPEEYAKRYPQNGATTPGAGQGQGQKPAPAAGAAGAGQGGQRDRR